jgi:hypothetical protein
MGWGWRGPAQSHRAQQDHAGTGQQEQQGSAECKSTSWACSLRWLPCSASLVDDGAIDVQAGVHQLRPIRIFVLCIRGQLDPDPRRIRNE